MRNYKRKSDRQSWQEKAMAAAINACRSGDIGYMKASKLYNVPRSTLKDRVKKSRCGKTIIEAAGQGRYNTVFSRKQEEELKLHITEMEPKLYELTSMDLRKIAYQFAEENGVKHNFNDETQKAGLDWVGGFMARHPDVAFFTSKTQGISTWSKQSTVLLIDLYKENIYLYDIQSEGYYNKQERKQALKNLVARLQEIRPTTTNSEVRAKLEHLKSAYLAVKGKMETSFIQGSFVNELCPASLWYYNKLSFLESCLIPHKYIPDEVSSSNDETSESSLIKTEEEANFNESNKVSDTSSCDIETSSSLVYTQLDYPYFIKVASSHETPSIATDVLEPPLPVQSQSQFISSKLKGTLHNDPLDLEIPPADDLKASEVVTSSSIEKFISYIGARLKLINSRYILQELEDDILLKIMQAEKEDRKQESC